MPELSQRQDGAVPTFCAKGRNQPEEVSTLCTKGGNQGRNQGGNHINHHLSNYNNNMLNCGDVWVSVYEAGEILGITVQAVRKNCKSGRYEARVVTGNGGKQYRILLASLPSEAQQKYFEKVAVRTFLGKGANQGANRPNEVSTLQKYNNNNALDDKEIWLSVKEAANLLSISERAVQRGCRESKYRTRRVWDNGGMQYRIALSSLQIAAQLRYYEKNITNDSGRRGRPFGEENLADMRVGLARAQFLRLYLRGVEQARQRGEKTVAAKRLFLARYNSGQEYGELFGILGKVSYATAERWRKLWEESKRDDRSLMPQIYRGKRGRRVTLEQRKLVLKYLLSPNKPRLSEAIRLARAEMAEKGIACMVSDRTLARDIEEWRAENVDLWIFHREGAGALEYKNLPFLQRDLNGLKVGDVVTADGHVFNFNIINPETGKPKRMTLIMVFDLKSNFPLGWEIMPTENTQAIASAYRHAILKLGFVPRVFYLDNGRAFRAKYFRGVESFEDGVIAGLFERLGCKVMFAWPYHGQSKPVERFFGSMAELERRLPAYVGNSIENKPARLQRGEDWHRRMHERLTRNWTPSLEEAHLVVEEWVKEYVLRPQQGGHLKGRRPAEVFLEGLEEVRLDADYASRVIEREELNYLMMETSVRKLYKNGIRLFGNYYYNDAMYTLDKSRSWNFTVKYDIQDRERVLVYDDSGRYLCTAYKTELYNPAARYLGSEEDVERLTAALRWKRGLRRDTERISTAFVESVMPVRPAEGQPSEARLPEREKDLPENLKWYVAEEAKAEEKLIMFREDEADQDEIFMFETDRNYALKKREQG